HHVRTEAGRAEEDRRRERGVDRQTRAVRMREGGEGGDVVDAQQRVGDRLGVQEAGRLGAERALDRRVVGGVDEDDVRLALPGPALEQRPRLSVAVLLRDDPSIRGDRAGVDERRDRRHPGDKTGDHLDALDLGEGALERGDGGRAVAAVDVSGPLVPEDGVLLRHRVVGEGDALHEGRDDGSAVPRWERAGRANDTRARSELPPVHQGSRVVLRSLFGRGRLSRWRRCRLEGLRPLDEVRDLLPALSADTLEVAGAVLRGHGAAALLPDTAEELGTVLVGSAGAALLPDLLVELRAVLLTDQPATHAASLGN